MSRRNDALVGLVILAGVAVVLFGTLWLKGVVLGQEERLVEARFREVGQLLVGNAVKVRGVPIGRVEQISLDSEGTGVIVGMRVRAGVSFPADPVVLLSPESMFGDWQAEIFPRTQFPRYNYAESADPGVLPGYSLPDISRLTAVADQIAENLAVLTERVEIAFTEQTARNLGEAIDNIFEVSREFTQLVRAQQRTVEEVGSNLETATATLENTAETIRRTFAEVEGAVGEGQLAEIVDNIRGTSAQLDSLTEATVLVSRELARSLTSADSTFRAFRVIVDHVEQGKGTLGLMFQDTTLYAELIRTNAQLRELLRDVQTNPRKYINLRVF